jgi:hypothetical protein
MKHIVTCLSLLVAAAPCFAGNFVSGLSRVNLVFVDHVDGHTATVTDYPVKDNVIWFIQSPNSAHWELLDASHTPLNPPIGQNGGSRSFAGQTAYFVRITLLN